MKILISSNIKSSVEDLYKVSDPTYWENRLKDIYGLDLKLDPKVHDVPWILRQICSIFEPIPPQLIRDCGVNTLQIKDDMGPNKPHYPNHGFYRPSRDLVALNDDIFYHPDQPDDFFDHRGYFISRPAQTLIHEFGHAFDAAFGDLSIKPEWLRLSGWSETQKPGLKRLIIKDPGVPEVVGEYFYDPKAGFTRFYAKRNPWDDFADSFSFYVYGMKEKLPANKIAYFDNLLKKYLS